MWSHSRYQEAEGSSGNNMTTGLAVCYQATLIFVNIDNILIRTARHNTKLAEHWLLLEASFSQYAAT